MTIRSSKSSYIMLFWTWTLLPIIRIATMIFRNIDKGIFESRIMIVAAWIVVLLSLF